MIVIHPYKDTWPSDFRAIQMQLAGVLEARALGIAHIGSTAVVGLAAKDVIDIQVAVEALDADLVARLMAAGYEYVARTDHDHVPAGALAAPGDWSKLYFRSRPGQRACHIHLRVRGRPNHRYALLFRDYLRAHAAACDTVQCIKRELARLHGDDADAYYAIKDPVYDLIWLAANAWAQATAWRLEDGSPG